MEDEKPPKKPDVTVREAGRRGGEATKAKAGPDFYREIGKLGGARMRKLLDAGKALEEREKSDG